MIYLFSIVTFILLSWIYFQHRANRKTSHNLIYLSEKLDAIISSGTSERLLLVTDDKALNEVLDKINRLLAHNHEIKADGTRMKMSMNRMLTNISHDLRTPMTVTLGNIETLRQNAMLSPSERDALLSKVQSKEKEVLHLINKFFDLAKLEAGDWEINCSRVHINEVCRKVMFSYHNMLINKHFEVFIDIPESPNYVYADEGALHRILDNLLSNAIHHGKDGRTIGLALRSDNHSIFIDVWDKGKGIQEKETKNIFERLYTQNNSHVLTEGNGIGLTITKQLTEQMNGMIHLSSIPHERTVFTVSFKKIR